MRIRRTADVQFEGDKEVVISVRVGHNSWEQTDYTRAEQKTFGDCVALMAEMLADVFNWDDGTGLTTMHEELKKALRRIQEATP